MEDFPLNLLSTVQKEIWQNWSHSLEDRRSQYWCGDNYIIGETLPSVQEMNLSGGKLLLNEKNNYSIPRTEVPLFCDLITITDAPLVNLEVDATVNAANNRCLGGGGVDGAIHKHAGNKLRQECVLLNGCKTGDAKITLGYSLPGHYIIHTVGPIAKSPDLLASCYRTCLRIAVDRGLTTIAFPCISTGVYGFPLREATHIALSTTRQFLDELLENIQDPTRKQNLCPKEESNLLDDLGSFVVLPRQTSKKNDENDENEKTVTDETGEIEQQTSTSTPQSSSPQTSPTKQTSNSEPSQSQSPSFPLKRIIFVCFRQEELDLYKSLVPYYFPNPSTTNISQPSPPNKKIKK
jgi:O-acetyl-ADP-ribose deacetylase